MRTWKSLTGAIVLNATNWLFSSTISPLNCLFIILQNIQLMILPPFSEYVTPLWRYGILLKKVLQIEILKSTTTVNTLHLGGLGIFFLWCSRLIPCLLVNWSNICLEQVDSIITVLKFWSISKGRKRIKEASHKANANTVPLMTSYCNYDDTMPAYQVLSLSTWCGSFFSLPSWETAAARRSGK